MLTFLNPGILLGLAAVSLPILIHLLNRQKVRKQPLSSIIFLRELREQRIRRLKLRQVLLLILRTLILALAVLAFARPTLRSDHSSAQHAKASATLVLILDNSNSMQYETRGQSAFARLQRMRDEIVQLVGPGDEVYIIHPRPDATQNVVGPIYTDDALIREFDRMAPAWHLTDIPAALRAATDVLDASTKLNKEVLLISDLQRIGDNDLPDSLLAPDTRLLVLPIQTNDAANIGVTDVRVANAIIERGKAVEIEAAVRNFGRRDREDVYIELALEGKRVGHRTVDLGKGQTKTVRFSVMPAASSGPLVGKATLEDDALMQDNERLFILQVPEAIRVLLIGNSGRDMEVVAAALKPGRQVYTQFEIETGTARGLPARRAADYDVVFLHNVAEFEAPMVTWLERFVHGGGGLVIIPGSQSNLRNYNETLHARLKLPQLGDTFGSLSDRRLYTTLADIDFEHPVFQDLFEDERREFDSPRIYFGVKLRKTVASKTVIGCRNGYSFLEESRVGPGRVLIFTTSVDRQWTDLAVKGLFAPLMNRSALYAAGSERAGETDVRVGDRLTLSWSSQDAGTNFMMERPGGSRSKIIPDRALGILRAEYTATDQPGVYRLLKNDQLVHSWVVNPHPDESELRYYERKEVEGLECAGVYFVRPGELEETVTSARFGRELWKYLVGAALVLALLEMAVYYEKRGVERRETEAMETAPSEAGQEV